MVLSSGGVACVILFRSKVPDVLKTVDQKDEGDPDDFADALPKVIDRIK